MRVPELKALTRERGLRGYSQLRKAELIAFLQDNAHPGAPQLPPVPQRGVPPPASPPQMSNWEPTDDRPRQPEEPLAPPLCGIRRIRRSSSNQKTTKA